MLGEGELFILHTVRSLEFQIRERKLESEVIVNFLKICLLNGTHKQQDCIVFKFDRIVAFCRQTPQSTAEGLITGRGGGGRGGHYSCHNEYKTLFTAI